MFIGAMMALPGRTRPTELPEVAFCLAGASRSLPSLPVLRGFRKNVLTSAHYESSVFAALSLDTTSPQPLEYNTTLMRQVASTAAVERALEHLYPQLRAVTFYNTSTAKTQFGARRCGAPGAEGSAEEPRDAMGTQVPMLYAVQLCYSLVRAHELTRGEVRSHRWG